MKPRMGKGSHAEAEKLFAQGMGRFEEGDHEAAAALFERSIAADGDYLAPHYMRGVAFNALGMLDEAAAEFAEVVRIDPGDGDGHFNLGNAYLHMGRFAEAIPLLEKGYALGVEDMTDDGALYNLATAHFELGKHENDLAHVKRAVELFEAVERANPLHAAAVFSRAMALLVLGRHTEAAAEFARVVAFDPASTHPTVVQSHVAEAVALTALGRFEEALGALREAVRKEPRVAAVAAKDPDFDALRSSPMGEGFAALVGAAPAPRLSLPCDVTLSMPAPDLASLRDFIYERGNDLVPAMQELSEAAAGGASPVLLVFGLRDRATARRLVELSRDWAYLHHPGLIKNLNWEYDRAVLAFADLHTRAPVSLADVAALASEEERAKRLPAAKKKAAAKKAPAAKQKTAAKKTAAKKTAAKKTAAKKKPRR